MKRGTFARGTTVSALALAIAAMGHATAARAQDVPDADDAAASSAAEERSSEEIIVTGSRLARTSFNSPTPVNVVDQARVENLNVTNVGDALNQIPSFRPLTTPATNSFRSSANIAGRSLDLRGLGATRTLTLIDGRRHVPSGDDGNFDLNSIPSILVRRSEVVTGGASAAYGAGAVSGVVNLILDTRLEGVKGELSYGISEFGDARKVYGALALGTGFAGGRGHILVGGEYSDESGVGDLDTRPWGRRHFAYVPNPFFSTNPAASNGLPANVGAANVASVFTTGGLVQVAHPLQGMQFDRNGNLIPFPFGALFNKAKPSSIMIAANPGQTYIAANGNPYMVATDHISVLGNVEYELTDSITASAGVSYAKVNGGPTRGSIRTDQNGAIVVRRDNAFLTASTKAAMDAAGVTTIPLSRSNDELGPNLYSSTNKTWEAHFGLEGDLFAGWKWDAFYQWGQTKGLQFNANARQEQRWKDAIDAVFAPAGIPGIAAGTIICRTTIANPTNGCIPANVMGAGNVSPMAAAWVNTIAYSSRKFTQNQLAANFRGTLFEGWAGPVTAAAGVEYRTNASSGDNDPASKLGLFSQQAWTILPATTQKVTEGYLEVNLPVFKDSAIGKSLEVDGAVRRTHYSLSGNATTWKVGGVWEINDEYMFRVTRSHDIRAPSPEELNPNQRILQLPLTDPKYNVQYQISTLNGGNPNLALETANTFTFGVVFQPGWIPKFRLSVDYYDIKVSGAIDLINTQAAANLCRAGNYPGVCRLGTDNAGNPDRILQLFATYQNLNQLHARGLEFVSSYSLELADVVQSLGGTLNFSLNGNYVDKLTTASADGTVKEYSGATGQVSGNLGMPRWRADTVITYAQRLYSVTAHLNYVPRSLLNPDWIGAEQDGYSPYLANSVNYNHVSSAFYLDLNARVTLLGGDGHKVELFGGVNNVFNRAPPPELAWGGNPVYYDNIGRIYKIGLRADW